MSRPFWAAGSLAGVGFEVRRNGEADGCGGCVLGLDVVLWKSLSGLDLVCLRERETSVICLRGRCIHTLQVFGVCHDGRIDLGRLVVASLRNATDCMCMVVVVVVKLEIFDIAEFDL